MTEVEELLRIATQIISNRLPEIDLHVELERSRNGEAEYAGHESIGKSGGSREAMIHQERSKRPRSTSFCPSTEPDAYKNQRSTEVDSDIHATYVENLLSPPESSEPFVSADALTTVSFDCPPMNGMDYDWDERQTDAAPVLDGMANLTIQNEQPGYLGLASGASLLHLIQSYSADPFATIGHPDQAALFNDQIVPPKPAIDLDRDIPSHKIAIYISDYFNTYHISYPLVHQGLFMAQYNEIIPRPKNGWMVLMYIVAALGAFMAATTSNDDDLILYHRARSQLSVEMLEFGNLTLVQGLTLISNYLQKRDRPNSGYNYLGLAVRMAFGLGLHKEFPSWKGNVLHLEMRRRTWWCLYVFDVGSTITYSRPLGIPSSGIDAKLPLNVFDSDLTAATAVVPENVSTPTVYTNVRVQAQFHLLTNNLYSRIISKPFPSAQQVLAWDDLYIGKWLSLVPEFYKDGAAVPERHALAHGIMTWRCKHLRMIIYRPFLIQKAITSAQSNYSQGRVVPDFEGNDNTSNRDGWASSAVHEELACERCRKESHETIQHIYYHWTNYPQNRMASWYALYFLIPAVLVPLISLMNEPQSCLADSWRDDINITMQVLKGMVELSPSAAKCLRVISELSAGYLSEEAGQTKGGVSDEQWLPDPIQESAVNQMLSMHSLMFPETSTFGMNEHLL